MSEIKSKKYIITKAFFWVWVFIFAWLYVHSTGFDSFRRIKLAPWLKQASGIVTNKPEAVATLNWHAQQALLNRLTFKELSVEENRRYFSRWDRNYLEFQQKAVRDLLRAQERARQTSEPVKTLYFNDLYHSGRLKITGAEIIEKDTSIYLKPASKSCRAELILPVSISSLSYDLVNIFACANMPPGDPASPFENYIRLFWKSNSHSEYSGERSRPVDLYNLRKKPHVEADMSKNILWLQGRDLSSILLVFHFSGESDIDLQKIEFHRSPSITPELQKAWGQTLE